MCDRLSYVRSPQASVRCASERRQTENASPQPADSHSIYWYLTSPGQPSARALAALVDPAVAVDVEPFGPAMWPHFETVSTVLADRFDSAIVAIALALGVEVVSCDRAITDSGTVGVIW